MCVDLLWLIGQSTHTEGNKVRAGAKHDIGSQAPGKDNPNFKFCTSCHCCYFLALIRWRPCKACQHKKSTTHLIGRRSSGKSGHAVWHLWPCDRRHAVALLHTETRHNSGHSKLTLWSGRNHQRLSLLECGTTRVDRSEGLQTFHN